MAKADYDAMMKKRLAEAERDWEVMRAHLIAKGYIKPRTDNGKEGQPTQTTNTQHHK
ncbi:MAG: hypothetical protein WAO71_12550 [Gallionella sp.]